MCFKCAQVGHYANRCPEPRQSSTPTSHPNISQAITDANQVRGDRKYYKCNERDHYAHQCSNQKAQEKEIEIKFGIVINTRSNTRAFH
jgi:hypothetical protein